MKKSICILVFAVFMINSIQARVSYTLSVGVTGPGEKIDLPVIIQLFPNAKKDKIELTTTIELKKIEIRSMEGKALKVIYSPKKIEIIDFSEYGKGTYFIDITTKENALITKKIVKE